MYHAQSQNPHSSAYLHSSYDAPPPAGIACSETMQPKHKNYNTKIIICAQTTLIAFDGHNNYISTEKIT